MAWVRIDTDFFTNDEVCNLTLVTRYAVISVMCYIKAHGSKGRVKSTPTQISRSVDIPAKNIKEALATSFFQVEDKEIQVLNWHKFQQDPTNAERQSRHRNRVTEVTEITQDPLRNGSNADTDTDTDNINTPYSPPQGDESKGASVKDQLAERFDRFWQTYPRKIGKGAARRTWAKIKPPEELTSRIIAAVQEQKQSPDWIKDNGQYIPHPATWLNQERWDDEVPRDEVSRDGLDDFFEASPLTPEAEADNRRFLQELEAKKVVMA